ncbi:MAG: hypothetical protein LBH43_02330 [Treponema sp.]|jgi:hypothetical protein|nr:hypothetical protein [Treponema sp.]
MDQPPPGNYEYIHYTRAGITAIDLTRSYPQTAVKLALHNPNGLWLSVAGIHDWERYCLKNNYHPENLKSEFQIILKPAAKILVLHSGTVFNEFTNEYGYYHDGIAMHGDNYTLNMSIKWEVILTRYQGIVIPISLPKLNNLGPWYNVWCCTCGCIWDLQAVEKAIGV